MAEDDTSNNNSGADNSNNNNTTASSPPTPSPPDNKKSSPPPSSPPPSSPPPSKDSPPPSSPPPSSPPPSKNSPPPSKDSSPPQSESGDKNGNDKGNDKDNNNNKSSPPPPDKQAGAENNDNKNNTPPPAENQSGAANNKDNNNSGGGANNENNKTPPAAPSGAESTTTNNNNADDGNGNTNANANTNTNADGGSNKNNNNGNSNSGKNAPADNQASPTPASKTPSSATPKNNNNSPTPASRVPSPPGVTSSGTPATKNSPAALNSPPSSSTSPSQASPDGSSNTNSGSSEGGGGSSGGKILTYSVIGAGGVGIILIALILFCVIRSKKKKRQPQFYGDQKGDPYYNGTDNWGNHQNWQNHPPGTDPSKLPPPPGGNAWQTQPGQPLTSSGEWSSQYSGGPHRQPLPPPSPNYAVGFNQSSFSYEELATATGGFSQGNLLGQGGFGYVHKGVLPNGKEVAVKSLKSGSGQGDREFQAEVEIISRVHHRHLVSLVGYCIANGQKMLVYEFVPNKTLEHHLHGRGLPVMDWETRMRIALGSAKGLAYLHEDCHPRIIHRDIKAANILIDNNFEAMVADFGLAKLTNDTNTHVSTRVMGTFGYLAPEYASSGKLSEKSDVFSFGVMLLELITGKRPVDASNAMEDSLVDWARPLLTKALEDGNYDELADPRMERNYVPHEMVRMIACGAASIRHSAKKRPRMSQIVRALEGDSSLEDLNDGTRPGHSSVYGVSSNATTEYSASSYQADMEKFRKLALGSQEFTSGEMGGTSSGDSRELRIPTGIPNKP